MPRSPDSNCGNKLPRCCHQAGKQQPSRKTKFESKNIDNRRFFSLKASDIHLSCRLNLPMPHCNGRGCSSMSCSLLLCSQSSSNSFAGCFALTMRVNLFDWSHQRSCKCNSLSPPNFFNQLLCPESSQGPSCTNRHLGWKVPAYADHGLRGRALAAAGKPLASWNGSPLQTAYTRSVLHSTALSSRKSLNPEETLIGGVGVAGTGGERIKVFGRLSLSLWFSLSMFWLSAVQIFSLPSSAAIRAIGSRPLPSAVSEANCRFSLIALSLTLPSCSVKSSNVLPLFFLRNFQNGFDATEMARSPSSALASRLSSSHLPFGNSCSSLMSTSRLAISHARLHTAHLSSLIQLHCKAYDVHADRTTLQVNRLRCTSI